MNFTSQICTTEEQSKRLLDLGLKAETADMYHYVTSNGTGISAMDDNFLPHMDTLAWSFHRLIEMMPTVITYENYSLILGVNATCVYYADDEYAETFKAFEGNLYECVVKCIDWLIKEGYFNKEYLKK